MTLEESMVALALFNGPPPSLQLHPFFWSKALNRNSQTEIRPDIQLLDFSRTLRP